MVEPIKKESSVTLGEMYELITKSKSQIRRINTQTGLTEVYWADPNEPADVDLLVQELAMANGHIEYLRGELQELQTEVERLTRFEVQHLIHHTPLAQPETGTTTFPKRPQLTRNAAECHNCHTIIESKHRHDWVQCNCVPPDNGIYVDGGLAYSRRGAGINANYTDLCEYE